MDDLLADSALERHSKQWEQKIALYRHNSKAPQKRSRGAARNKKKEVEEEEKEDKNEKEASEDEECKVEK